MNYVASTSGTISVHVAEDDRSISIRDGNSTNHNIKAKFLEEIVPDFAKGRVQAMAVTIHKGTERLRSYHVYNGGSTFGPTLPEEQISGGVVIPVSMSLLTADSFVRSLPRFQMTNAGGMIWGASRVIVNEFSLHDNKLTLNILQDSPFVDIGEFTITGTVNGYPGSSPQYGGIFLQFALSDCFRRTTDMRIQFDGFSAPTLQILRRRSFYKASLISFDGFRFFVVYSSGHVATVYLKAPTDEIYALGNMNPYSGSYLNRVIGRYASAFQIEVTIRRSLEANMLMHNSEYDIGRLGSEIAYVVATNKLGLHGLVIQEPSVGGRDLYTHDNSVAIQTRFLVNLDPSQRDATIKDSLLNVVKKLQQDYANQDRMIEGYAILTYVDMDDSMKALVLNVPRERHPRRNPSRKTLD